MFLGGLALLAAFAVPLHTSPLSFQWNLILDGQGLARLPPLMLGAVGLLGIVLAVMPMPVAPRGVLATLLGLAGIAVPIALVGVPPWQALAPLIGLVVLVPSLLVRNEYRDALLARVLVTLGAIGILLPFLVPQNDAIPLVSVFKRLIDLPGSQKVGPALVLSLITIVVMSLLAWLPAPATGAAKVWAWLLILWALFLVNGSATSTKTVGSQGLRPPAAGVLRPGDRVVSVDGDRSCTRSTAIWMVSIGAAP